MAQPSPNPHPLDILFLTNFSDHSFRSIPAIAQMADAFRVRLTIMHVYDPQLTRPAEAESRTQSFFPEADRYPACHRIAVAGPIREVIARHLERWPINLIAAPASDVIGLPRLGQASFRAKLIDEFGVPVWTFGRRIDFSRLTRPVRNVACWLDHENLHNGQLPYAIAYARALKARLHLLCALPHFSEGSLVHPDHQSYSLHPASAAHQIRELCADASISPEISVSAGAGPSVLRKMLTDLNADVVFFGQEKSPVTSWLGLGLRMADTAPCPAFYIGDRVNVPVWNLEPRGPARRSFGFDQLASGQVAAARSRPRNGTGISPVLTQLGIL